MFSTHLQDVDVMKTDQWEQKFLLEMKTRLFTDVAQLENASVSIITLLVKHVIPVNQVLNHFQNAMNVLLKENGVLIVLKVSDQKNTITLIMKIFI